MTQHSEPVGVDRPGAKTAVIGAGAWGTALALLLAGKGLPVSLWTWQEPHAERMRQEQENQEFLPGFPLPPSMQITSDLGVALAEAEVVLLVVPSDVFRETLERARELIPPSASLVTATKGIEQGSLMLMNEVIVDVLGSQASARVGVLSGPSFAKEVASGVPTNIVIAAHDPELAERLQQHFATGRFRVYSSDDPVGVEVGGALKNVIAIAAGACDGLGFGNNTRAALITRGLAELSRLAVAKQGNPLTLAGLAGMGDLVLTCTGELSRNRTVGFELGRGRELSDVLGGLGHVAEGVKTARSTYDLAQRLGVELPICFEVYRVLYEGKSPHRAVEDVLTRPLKRELD
ncbi:MAG: NAD(P)-dependent glycerol-3-phosphate dehydrogenase [Polyangiaceae bacterium]|nr:NAD(P)-dependent glycerol-3-phosphate dehydrogenase [Polyangiaceae bacterium]MCB9605467.1 NAD(P)-dependent glycerol-3-phosphate dehydrogenase [Polyangiaceae bacterium]